MRFRLVIAALAVLVGFEAGVADAASTGKRMVLFSGAPGWVLRGTVPADLDCDWASGRFWQKGIGQGGSACALTVVRAAPAATDLLPTSALGYPYKTFQPNVARITPGVGLLPFQGLTNFLLNSAAPATQTTGSLGTGTYTLWVNGPGAATLSGGTGTGCGAATASQGTVATFTITVAGTCTVTVSGSLNAFQLDNTSFGGPLCPTAGTSQSCAADVVTLTKSPLPGGAYTLFARGVPFAPANSGTPQQIAQIENTNSNRAGAFRSASGVAEGINASAGTTTVINTFTTWAQNAVGRVAISSSPGSQLLSFNGAATSTGAGSLPIGANAVRVGSDAGPSSYFNGAVPEIAILASAAQPAAQLQALGSR